MRGEASARRASIDPVADDSAPERRAGVGADLVGASRHGTKLDQSGPVANRDAAASALLLQGHVCQGPSASRLRRWSPSRGACRSPLRPRQARRRSPPDNIFRPSGFERRLKPRPRLGVRASSRQPLVSVSSRCIGVGSRLNPHRNSPSRAAKNGRRGAGCRPATGRLVDDDRLGVDEEGAVGRA